MWISVEDRLPDIGRRVLVVNAPYYDGEPLVAKRIKHKDDGKTIPINSERATKDWVWQFDGRMMLTRISHWMSFDDIPAPPDDE